MTPPKRLLICWLLGPALLAGCGGSASQAPAGPRPRVLSYAPALTSMLFDLGLGDHVVGVTSYCSLPPGEQRPVVGDALNVRVEPALATRPDLLVVQNEPRRFEAIARIQPDLPIEHFTIETLDDIASGMQRLAELCGKPDLGLRASRNFRDRLAEVRARTAGLPRRRVLFVMGYEDPMGGGRGTFLDQMIRLAGGTNVLADQFAGWRGPSLETVLQLRPEVLVCEARPGREDRAEAYWRQLWSGRDHPPRVVVVTDRDWSIPAAHLADRTAELAEIIHPEALRP